MWVFVCVLRSHPRGCMGWYVIYYQAYHSHITHVRKSDQPVIISKSIVIARGVFKQQNDKAAIEFVMNCKYCNLSLLIIKQSDCSWILFRLLEFSSKYFKCCCRLVLKVHKKQQKRKFYLSSSKGQRALT